MVGGAIRNAGFVQLLLKGPLSEAFSVKTHQDLLFLLPPHSSASTHMYGELSAPCLAALQRIAEKLRSGRFPQFFRNFRAWCIAKIEENFAQIAESPTTGKIAEKIAKSMEISKQRKNCGALEVRRRVICHWWLLAADRVSPVKTSINLQNYSNGENKVVSKHRTSRLG